MKMFSDLGKEAIERVYTSYRKGMLPNLMELVMENMTKNLHYSFEDVDMSESIPKMKKIDGVMIPVKEDGVKLLESF